LETVPEDFQVAARKFLREVKSKLHDELKHAQIAGQIRFADNLSAPSAADLDGDGRTTLIPAEWSMVFSDSYAGQVARRPTRDKQPVREEDIRRALGVLLVSFLWQTSQVLHTK
jgi:hypothetical protein